MTDASGTRNALAQIWSAVDGAPSALGAISEIGEGDWASAFAVSDLAAGSIGAAALAAAELCAAREGRPVGETVVDRRLASLWFGMTIRPEGWSLPPTWDAVAGDYPTRDGWIRLHTNAPHHRDAAMQALGVLPERTLVADAVATWEAAALAEAVIAAGGCAAAMHDEPTWAAHPQGAAVAAEPLVWLDEGEEAQPLPAAPEGRPLAGLRVLDLTRIFAGPVATRFLAAFGADVLRIDPLDWEEPSLAPEVTLGKRCARLDLRDPAGRARLAKLIASADVMVHGYRPGALDGLGFDTATRRALNPGLVDVSLCAYGWTGPWAGRRGFDSLVQMSSGIAAAGMAWAGADKPTPLPVQALDHAAGYIMAAAAMRGLTHRLTTGRGSAARTSLARVARLLTDLRQGQSTDALPPVAERDYAPAREQTAWGSAHRLRAPVAIEQCPLAWPGPAVALGSTSQAGWLAA